MTNLPKVTIAIITYNQEKFISESFKACLEQDYKNLTIVISDDASTDNTNKIIEKMVKEYQGPHKVIHNQNKVNLGIGHHFAYIMDNLVEGELVITTGGDDISKKNRASRIVEEWQKNNMPSLVAHSLEEINENGNIIKDFRTFQYANQDHSVHSNQIYSLNEYQKYQYPLHYIGAAVAYSTNIYSDFGKPTTYPDCEDHMMYFRALLSKGTHYFPEVLVSYRRHKNSYTALRVKPLSDEKNSTLSSLLNKNNTIPPNYINCYISQKITVQQWIDYTLQIKKNKIKIDVQLIEQIWNKTLHRHKFLIKNKDIINKIKTTINQLKYYKKDKRYDAKKYIMDYMKPLNTVIFGTADGAINTLSKIGPGFNIIYACNSTGDYSNRKFKGLEVISLKKLDEISDKVDCIIIASNKYFEIMQLILENTSITKNKIARLPSNIISKMQG